MNLLQQFIGAKSGLIENSYSSKPEHIQHQNELALNYPIKFIQKYLKADVIENAIRVNPNIKRILEENKLSLKFNIENVTSIVMSHLIPTANMTKRIYKNMGKSETDEHYVYLVQAALLHDIGKVFIPSEILNKRGKLTSKEREIIELHNTLSYEILKTTDLDKQVAKLAFEHHNYNGKLVRTLENQALTIADVYCALKEVRPYKKAISDICAKAILYDMGTKGSLDSRYINCINS